MPSAKIRTKWIIGRTKWIFEYYFSNLALVEYCTKWIRIKWGPGVYWFSLIQITDRLLWHSYGFQPAYCAAINVDGHRSHSITTLVKDYGVKYLLSLEEVLCILDGKWAYLVILKSSAVMAFYVIIISTFFVERVHLWLGYDEIFMSGEIYLFSAVASNYL